MSVDTISPPAEPPEGPLYRLGVEAYFEMARLGILGPDDKVELLEGMLVEKMVKYPPHIHSTKRCFSLLTALLPPGWHVAKEDPIRVGTSVPEPDISVLRGQESDYREHWPDPHQVGLVVEVADASLARDRRTKRRICGGAGLAVYWLVNLVQRRIEVHIDPTGPGEAPGYRSVTNHLPDKTIPFFLDGVEVGRVAVADILP